jgi:hypothetical protein
MSSLRSWLGFREQFDFSKARGLGGVVGVLLILVVGSLFILAVLAAFKVLGASLFGTLPKGTGASFGLTGIIVAMIGAPFVIWRTMVAQKQEKKFGANKTRPISACRLRLEGCFGGASVTLPE